MQGVGPNQDIKRGQAGLTKSSRLNTDVVSCAPGTQPAHSCLRTSHGDDAADGRLFVRLGRANEGNARPRHG